ncbi:hypothetical protein FXO38_14166 [Capsicum annuum]|nr:hypothetical protein FXO38_14166 [Capsicum annuum]
MTLHIASIITRAVISRRDAIENDSFSFFIDGHHWHCASARAAVVSLSGGGFLEGELFIFGQSTEMRAFCLEELPKCMRLPLGVSRFGVQSSLRFPHCSTRLVKTKNVNLELFHCYKEQNEVADALTKWGASKDLNLIYSGRNSLLSPERDILALAVRFSVMLQHNSVIKFPLKGGTYVGSSNNFLNSDWPLGLSGSCYAIAQHWEIAFFEIVQGDRDCGAPVDSKKLNLQFWSKRSETSPKSVGSQIEPPQQVPSGVKGNLEKMVSNCAEDVKICGSGEVECPETTVPVPALKEQIATVTGVLTEQQRLICRGKVLKDDQLLSAYHVEDGHTLHLVVRQPSSESTPDPQDIKFKIAATASASRAGYSQGNRVSPGVVVGYSSEHGGGIFPDLNRIVAAVLGSVGIASAGSGNEGIDLNVSIKGFTRNPMLEFGLFPFLWIIGEVGFTIISWTACQWTRPPPRSVICRDVYPHSFHAHYESGLTQECL